MIFNFLLEAVLLLVPLVYFKRNGLNAVKELGLEGKKASSAWKYSLIILGAMALVSFALALVFNFFGANDISKVADVLQAAKSASLFFVFTITVGVVLEEFFFRGFLIKFIDRQLWGEKKSQSRRAKARGFLQEYSGVILSSLFFGVLHFGYGSVSEIIGAVSLGLVLALFFKKYQNLYANTYAHLLWNAIVIFGAGIA
ncbi:MAG: CPBP family intramembrane metalloprotease [Candidatus Diapherotrites archaeon]|nr:CPBP family intramembrane metalloprotease [Candidatus Diapherotrites archaeon]